MDQPPADDEPRAHEPLFRAPMAVLFVCAALIGAHAALTYGPVRYAQVIDQYALTGQAMAERRWLPLFSYMALHGSWMHVALNCVFCLAFGTAPARLFGRDLRGAAVFVGFFLACGAIAGLLYAAIQPDRNWAAIGASAAVSGLMGATARMLHPGGRLGPPWGRGFFSMALSWLVINAFVGLTGLGSGLGPGVPVAWQAHIFGFAVGAGLIDLFWGLAGRRDPITQ
jgi:membrane associated rhomboid family serine protease